MIWNSTKWSLQNCTHWEFLHFKVHSSNVEKILYPLTEIVSLFEILRKLQLSSVQLVNQVGESTHKGSHHRKITSKDSVTVARGNLNKNISRLIASSGRVGKTKKNKEKKFFFVEKIISIGRARESQRESRVSVENESSNESQAQVAPVEIYRNIRINPPGFSPKWRESEEEKFLA